MQAMVEMTLQELAARLDAELMPADAQGLVRTVRPLDAAGPDCLSFATTDRHQAAARTCQAGVVLVPRPIPDLDKPQLVTADVDAALIKALRIFAPVLAPAPEGVHPTAVIGSQVKLGDHVSIGPFVVIEDGVRIGHHTVIGAGCKVGQGTEIGDHTVLHQNVVIYHGCKIGSHVVIQANSTIGSIGFGYAVIGGRPELIPHNGAVVIEDYVEIGANCCIDRAKFTNTVIGAGTKLDNLVQIGHNVIIGKCCLISAQVGIAGSCRIGDGVVLAGQAGVADNLSIGDRAMIGAQAGVMSDVPPGAKKAWSPALDQSQALRVVGELLRLPRLAAQLKELAKRVERLEASKDHP